MEGAFLNIIGVTATMIVEITVMKMDVCDGRWEDTQYFTFCKALFRTEQNILNESTTVQNSWYCACDCHTCASFQKVRMLMKHMRDYYVTGGSYTETTRQKIGDSTFKRKYMENCKAKCGD